MNKDQQRWDERYQGISISQPEPAKVLVDNQHLLPKQGCSLEIACGQAGNALLLAQQGLQSHAWDISSVIINALDYYTEQQAITLYTQVRDVVVQPPLVNSFDVIVVIRYLERSLCGAIQQALKPGGLLFYQTYSQKKVSEQGPDNPIYRLAPNELLELFPALQLLVYREEGHQGDLMLGWRDEAMLVAQKPLL